MPLRSAPLAPAELAEIIEQVLTLGVPIVPTTKFRRRGRERNFTIEDAIEVFRTGTITRDPIWNETHEDWNYDILGFDVEGQPLTIRFAVLPRRGGVILITGF